MRRGCVWHRASFSSAATGALERICRIERFRVRFRDEPPSRRRLGGAQEVPASRVASRTGARGESSGQARARRHHGASVGGRTLKSRVEKSLRAAAWTAGAAGVLWLSAASLQGDPAKDIKAKEPEKRVAAIEGVKALGGEAAEKLLTPLLLDRDWEVVERAAAALRDVGTKASVPQLVKTAIDGPTHRARLAAAESLAKIDPERALADLAKLTPGKSATRAWIALAVVAPHASD